MLDIITDPDLGARFVILLLVRLGAGSNLEHAVTVYKPVGEPIHGHVELEVV